MILRSLLLRPCSCSARNRNRYGSVPLVAATDFPFSDATPSIAESGPTTSAVHSGREYTYRVLIGLPLALASTAARPAVEPRSTLPLLRYSSARLLPRLSTQLTSVPSAFSACSSQPNFFTTRLVGE